MTLFYLLILGAFVFCAFLLINKRKTRKQIEETKKIEESQLTIENLRKDGVFTVRNLADFLEDVDLVVTGRHKYQQGNTVWFELECDSGGKAFSLEYGLDDNLEISISFKKMKLRDLKLSLPKLEKIDEEEEGEFDFDNTKYYYEDSDEAIFFRDCQESEEESFYYWEFESKNGNKTISIEKWPDGSTEVSMSETVELSDITIYGIN